MQAKDTAPRNDDKGANRDADRKPLVGNKAAERAKPWSEVMGKVLVIDDQRNMRTTLAMMLRSNGFEVDEAANGENGKELGAAGAYDVVITDLRMGDIDGIEVLR